METVLVVDDDRAILSLVERALQDSKLNVVTEMTAKEGLAAIRELQPDVLLLDINLPDISGLEISEQIRDIDPKLPIVYITLTGSSNLAIQAMQRGAYDFLVKPLGVETVQDVVERSLRTRRMMRVPVVMNESVTGIAVEATPGDALVGRSPKLLEVYKEIGRVAGQDVTVLIFGESGTGKELIARAIYQHSRRKDRPFLAVNCAALSETLLESELFGHEKGSFTGADRRRIGKFEQCSGGTILLDEVGDMSPSVQSKVLRLVQEQKFERVGGSETIQTDVRIIAATNRELEKMVQDGDFRLDLFHRLNEYRIVLPPLRERGDDIVLLAEFFLARLRKSLEKPVQGISEEALNLMKKHPWPGNVRELHSALKKAVLKATGPVITPEFLPDSVRQGPSKTGAEPAADDSPLHDLEKFIDRREREGSWDLYAETLEMMERYLVTRLLRKFDGNQTKAAERLGITRGSLRHKLRTLRISIERVVE